MYKKLKIDYLHLHMKCLMVCLVFRLSSAITEEDAIKASAKDTASIEDQQLAEALARYIRCIILY